MFHQLARELGLIPADLPATKSDVRDHLRSIGKEDAWTRLQAEGYGPRMKEATAFPGVMDFFKEARTRGITLFIVSHKTKHPYAGPAYDLHEAAMNWLELAGFFDVRAIGLPRDHVFLELSKQAKLARIAELNCTHFIDDLPEFLAEPAFPKSVNRLLFDPGDRYHDETQFSRLREWSRAWDAIALSGDRR